MFNRRQWLRGAAALGCAPLLRAFAAAGAAQMPAVSRPLEILVLGGTGFLGPHQVNYALGRGHRVTLFNRGLSAAGLFGDRVELLRGDRDARVGLGLAALEGTRRWDVVIDNSGFLPRHVRDAATLLRGRVTQYVFVSSGAVYDGTQGEVFDERGPLRRLADAASELQSPETYGPLKAECERVVAQLFPGRCTILRPTYVFGPGDDTDRFTYWIERLALGGEVLGRRSRTSSCSGSTCAT
ncbi:MAG: NAD-dependent epimerase/dehydratase family protein [Steroidobacteraceae bacterium]